MVITGEGFLELTLGEACIEYLRDNDIDIKELDLGYDKIWLQVTIF